MNVIVHMHSLLSFEFVVDYFIASLRHTSGNDRCDIGRVHVDSIRSYSA